MVWDFFKKFVLFGKENSVVRRISRLTTMGLLVSITALILVLSVMTGLNRSQRDRTLAVEPHLSCEVTDAKDLHSVENHPALMMLSTKEAVRAHVFETQDVIVRTLDGKFRGAMARGLSRVGLEDMLTNIGGDKLGSHELLTNLENGEVFIGVDLARSLGAFEGDTLLIIPPEGLLLPPSEAPKFERVKIRQILSTSVSDVDSQQIFYVGGESLRSLRDSASRRLGFEVRMKDPDQADQLKAELAGFPGLNVQTWKELNSALFLALLLEKSMIGIFLGMAALVAGLSLLSVLALLISQKRKEIGLLQAIGMSPAGVRALFTKIGFLLALIGLGSGIILGTSLSLYMQWYPLNILPDIYIDSQVPSEVQPFLILGIAVFGLSLAYLGSRWAAASLKGQSPSSLLRGSRYQAS